MKNNLLYLIFALLFFAQGAFIIENKIYKFNWHESFYLGKYSTYVGVAIILLGCTFVFLFLKIKTKPTPPHTICPTCKETYNYSDLKDGKCPKCDVDTVDIDKYYKDNPFEEDDH